MNDSTIDPIYTYSHVIYYLSTLGLKVSLIFCPILYLNYVILFMFSSLWAIYLTRSLWKNYRKEKITSKLRRNYPEYQWLNTMENFKTNKIKNCFLLAICFSEIIMCGTIMFANISYVFRDGGGDMKDNLNTWLDLYYVFLPYSKTHQTEITSHIIGTVITTSTCTMLFFVRILTQFMVYRYSYFKTELNIIFQFYLFFTCMFALIIMELVLELFLIHCVCFILVLFREYIVLVTESRKLCQLLRQHTHDATHHENLSKYVTLLYRIAYTDYKKCSIIILIAFSLQIIGIVITTVDIVLDNLAFDFPLDSLGYCYFTISEYSFDPLRLVSLTLGVCLQTLLYMFVSLRRSFRYIQNRFKNMNQFSSTRYLLQPLIENNNLAYRKKNDCRNVLL